MYVSAPDGLCYTKTLYIIHIDKDTGSYTYMHSMTTEHIPDYIK